jgi:hypothetical protein
MAPQADTKTACATPAPVCVPQKREAIRNISTFRTEFVAKVEHYEVQVPRIVEKEIEVEVCRMVPRTVACCTCAPVTANQPQGASPRLNLVPAPTGG